MKSNNGHLIATFRVPKPVRSEFERVVLAFGQDCEVVKTGRAKRVATRRSGSHA